MHTLNNETMKFLKWNAEEWKSYLLDIFLSSWLYLETTSCAFVSPTCNWIEMWFLFYEFIVLHVF